MRLSVQEAAALLGAPEAKVYAWIEDDALPAQRVRGQLRINRAQLLEWATERGIAVSPKAFEGASSAGPTLAASLRAGGVHHGLRGSDLPTVLRALVAGLPLADEADRETLLDFLVAGDELAFAAIGEGIAIPHVRRPIVLGAAGGEDVDTALAVAFVETPLALDAPDGKPVDTLFFLVSPTIPSHLAMLARVAWALQRDPFRSAVRRHAPADELLKAAVDTEAAGR